MMLDIKSESSTLLLLEMVLPIFSELASYVVSKLTTRVRRTGKAYSVCVFKLGADCFYIY